MFSQIVKFLILNVLFVGVAFSQVDPRHLETRYCNVVERNADGTIKRDSTVTRAFRKLYACPSTGEHTGPCPNWAIDHIIPLSCGGCDSVSNLQWLPNAIKSGKYPSKDRWERQIYNNQFCTPKIQN